VEGISILPLTFEGLERATQLRRQAAKADSTNRRDSRADEAEMIAESSYLLLSTNRSACLPSGAEREQQRTGRWTDEEIVLVDYLVMAFDQGLLSLPHGIKLNEFLGDLLICKSSRLTKKMKNAKLSTRSFALGSLPQDRQNIDHRHLSALQEKFLQSITSEPTQLELRFNITKQWRTHFSNLCVQVGYPYLDGREWAASLEEMERRATNAEELIRKNRRVRMGLALQTDGGSAASSNVFIGGVQADVVSSQAGPSPSIDPPEPLAPRRLSNSDDGSEEGDEDMFSLLEAFDSGMDGPEEPQAKRARTRTLSEDIFADSRKQRAYSEDFESVLRGLIDTQSEAVPDQPRNTSAPAVTRPPNHTCGPFLDAITMFMEARNLPFQHADVWVPSFLPRETKGPSKAVDTEQLRLFHAGYATRGDLDDDLAHSLHEFGIYSDNFSFEPGHGLPGRVYSAGEIAWECGIDEADPKKFERAGGAKVYGVKTAVGIPLSTPLVGRIVVAMYSKYYIHEDMNLAKECAAELMKYSPEPKWKLVIEMNNEPQKYSSRDSKPQAKAVAASALAPTQGVGCSSPSGTPVASIDHEEQRIVTLLGEHMPLSDNSTGEATSSSAENLQYFLSMRLLLLRPAGRRTARENEMIDILKSSFRAYAKDNRRGGAELAGLLAKDWICLKQTFAAMDGASTSSYQPVVRRNSSVTSAGAIRRGSSTDVALAQTHAQLQQSSFNTHQPGPRMSPMFGIPHPTRIAPFRRESLPMSNAGRHGSIASQVSQPLSQPQHVLSSRAPDGSRFPT
jgi:bHLH-MYC and R2R3-MYB transcription factors N-terminal